MNTQSIRIALSLMLGLALAAPAGCSADVPTGPTMPVTPAATGTPTGNPAEDEARSRILAVYNGYLEAFIKASATSDYRTIELAAYVGEPLLGQLLNGLYIFSLNGIHSEGRPTWSPTVAELSLSTGEAVIQDCFDGTNWNSVGGKTPPPPQAKRYPVVVKAKQVNGRWYVYESVAERGSPC
ncbi:hypothetical protein KZZ52_41575 [Dactylosporangium sp. AC04546]|uniref:hypothetical protein n=1 Tax=Dactylosporangium sp. AC04546 TaxID=2862460 RepID=UPI001EDCDF4B|nr:hypothetical protein [Dactylosporangium sp. AC04546]WVK80417.1 hypothetical protein KZZ52_41575 [Dactylosporangium sp. AC04546]